jgi:O-succinylbenzoic acid--CoA ligase
MRMPHWLDQRAALTPQRTALIGAGERVTFAELRDRARDCALRLAACGVASGDRVALLCRNGLHVPVIVHALSYLGAVLVPLNTRLTVFELDYQLRDADCRMMIYDPDYHALAAELRARGVGVTGMQTDELWSIRPVSPSMLPPAAELETDALHSIMYTSGTTGQPKGVQLSYHNHWSSAIGSVLNLGLTDRDCWLAAVPLFHISGLSILMRSVIYGMPVVIHERFDPVEANRAIREQGVTIVSVVSNMLRRMVDALGDERYPPSFRCMLLGGGPSPLPLLEQCREMGIPVIQTYGMTETASQVATLPAEYMLSKLGSAGKPLFISELRIVRDGVPVPPGTEGEIEVRGPNVMRGYWNRPEVTAEVLRDGWLATGDLGYVDEEGFLYVLDRRKDLIISGGENVYPAEIESVLMRHPDIVEAGVTGQADDVWGQVPIAFVVMREGAVFSEQEIRDFCARRLARYKIPARIYAVDGLPRNASNKLMRCELVKLIPPEVVADYEI